jgi:gluconate kinase
MFYGIKQFEDDGKWYVVGHGRKALDVPFDTDRNAHVVCSALNQAYQSGLRHGKDKVVSKLSDFLLCED